jgi:hypothetical protein
MGRMMRSRELKWLSVALGVCAAATGQAFAQAPESESLRGQPLVIRACVSTGVNPGTFVLNRVVEVRPGGRIVVPRGLARPVIYWLNEAGELRDHVGRMVEVRGTIGDVEASEAEVRADADEIGRVVVELEGPGENVEAMADAIPGVVGTSGTQPDRTVETVVLEIDVDAVTPVTGNCA